MPVSGYDSDDRVSACVDLLGALGAVKRPLHQVGRGLVTSIVASSSSSDKSSFELSTNPACSRFERPWRVATMVTFDKVKSDSLSVGDSWLRLLEQQNHLEA